MMKRVQRLNAAGGDDQSPLIITAQSQIQQQPGVAGVNVHSQSAALSLHESPSPHQTTIIVSAQPVINYSKGGGGGALQYAGVQYPGPPKPPQPAPPHHQAPHPRHKAAGNQSPGAQVQVTVSQAMTSSANAVGPPGSGATFQRLKVEDALSYLDQVKYKFNNQPQVYNDFLDIMKEFKSQSIDTPGVIARVSNLFKGHPELIVGFNTFLPPGYKIEVQANDQGYAYQVSVSMPSPNSCSMQHQQAHNNVGHASAVLSGSAAGILVGSQAVQPSSQHQQQHLVHILPGSGSSAIVHNLSTNSTGGTVGGGAPGLGTAVLSANVVPTNTLHHISQAHQQLETPAAPPPPNSSSQPVEFNHAIEYVNKIKNRFIQQPEKYKRFLEILHAYQRGQKELKEPQVKQQTEQEVYAQVAKLFEKQDDLLREFGQFLPDATGGGGIGGVAIKATAALEAGRSSIQSRPRQTIHPPQRDSIMDSDHSVGSLGRAPSPGYTATTPIPSVQQISSFNNILRAEKELPSSLHIPSSQSTNQHSSSQVSLHHHSKHSTASHHVPSGISSTTHHLKRSPSFSSSNQLVGPPPPKKHKLLASRDITIAEAAKYGSQRDYSFFDRVRSALRNNEVYDNFLRCLLLFTNEIVSKSELLAVTAPFFCRHPELQRWLQEFLDVSPCIIGGSPPTATTASSPPPATVPIHASLGNGSHRDLGSSHISHPYSILSSHGYGSSLYSSSGGERYTGENNTLSLIGAQLRQDRPQGDAAMEIDLTTCRRLGTSYCALPRGSADSPSRRCSGRTPLCRDVLNETWVSFPTWAEDSTFVTSRKTQYEEYIYRCEDERFELDVVIETNASTILALESVHKKLCRMNPEEASRFRLDDCLGGTSPTIHQRALKRIYGDRANDIISGLKKNPSVAVPIVLRRLKGKEEEWREAQKGFNKQWRELNEKYYLKSLDYQGVNFKQNDLKALRSKSLFNEIETAYDERRRCVQSMVNSRGQTSPSNIVTSGPHMTADCGPGGAALLADAADLLIHHVRRQTAIQKQEKQRVKQLLRHFLPDLFQHPRHPLSDDERDDDDKELDVAMDSPCSGNEDGKTGLDNEADPEPKSSSRLVKMEKDLSSESDTNTSSVDKISTKGPNRLSKEEKNSNRENKENMKHLVGVRNNSADSDVKESSNSLKSSENHAKNSGRRREGSNDSATKIKSEPIDNSITSESINISNNLENNREMRDGKGLQPTIFFGSGHWYVFLRLHALLCQRLAAMKDIAAELAREENGDSRLRRPGTAVALRLKPENTLPVSQYYPALLEMIRSVLDGNTEALTYEDNLRDMFGVRAYIAFTLDKVVSYAVRQLQQCVQERTAIKCVDLHIQERGRGFTGLAAYQRKAQKLLRDEHAFKISILGGEQCQISFELLDSGAGGMGSSNNVGGGSEQQTSQGLGGDSPTVPPAFPARLAEWARYRERYANPSTMDTDIPDGFYRDGVWCGRKAIYLPRNVKRFQKLNPDYAKLILPKPSANLPTVPLNTGELSTSTQSLRPANVGSSDDEDMLDTPPSNRKSIMGQSKEINSDPTINKESKDWSSMNSNVTSSYINEDNTEVLFDKKPNYKFVYILNKEHYYVKNRALKRAWECHKAVSKRQENRWRTWLGNWCGRNVTSAQSRSTSEWLRRGIRVVTAGESDTPPYGPYTRYRQAATPPHAPDR